MLGLDICQIVLLKYSAFRNPFWKDRGEEFRESGKCTFFRLIKCFFTLQRFYIANVLFDLHLVTSEQSIWTTVWNYIYQVQSSPLCICHLPTVVVTNPIHHDAINSTTFWLTRVIIPLMVDWMFHLSLYKKVWVIFSESIKFKKI